jgi:hypothetical protein
VSSLPDWVEFPLIVFFSILAAGLALVIIGWVGNKLRRHDEKEGK